MKICLNAVLVLQVVYRTIENVYHQKYLILSKGTCIRKFIEGSVLQTLNSLYILVYHFPTNFPAIFHMVLV